MRVRNASTITIEAVVGGEAARMAFRGNRRGISSTAMLGNGSSYNALHQHHAL